MVGLEQALRIAGEVPDHSVDLRDAYLHARLRSMHCAVRADGGVEEDDGDGDADAIEAEELDRDIETLEVRLSLAENGIEEAMAVLGLKSGPSAAGDSEAPKPVKRTCSVSSGATAVSCGMRERCCIECALWWVWPLGAVQWAV